MRYFVIAGEASGDLHARHLMDAIRVEDAEAEIQYWYRSELAYMGFMSVLCHLPEIIRGMNQCKAAIRAFAPDRLILVDYPGFNLKIAAWFYRKYIEDRLKQCPSVPKVVYYIPPKIWAWKEGRIKHIRKYTDMVLSILPFEVNWYAQKHSYDVDYVGNPTLDEISYFQASVDEDEVAQWKSSVGIGKENVVALMPGSRKQEIERNLPLMLVAAESVGGDYYYVIASAPNMSVGFYENIIAKTISKSKKEFMKRIRLAPCQGSRSSFMLLHCSFAALVTSGTATLETAILGVPQVVCYSMACGKVVSVLRKLILKIPYVSLVNLIAGYEVVPELIAGELTPMALKDKLSALLKDRTFREGQLCGYDKVRRLLGEPGAPQKAARIIIK